MAIPALRRVRIAREYTHAARKSGRGLTEAALLSPSSCSFYFPRPPPNHAKQVANSREAMETPTSYTHDRVIRAQLADKLQELVTNTLFCVEYLNDSWFAEEFAGNVAALAAADLSGDAKAAAAAGLAMMRRWYRDGDEEFRCRILESCTGGNEDAALWLAACSVRENLANGQDGREHVVTKVVVMRHLLVPAERGSRTAQHILGMFMYYSQCGSGTKADFFSAARWIRKAAMHGEVEAQYELGEMFRRGIFCDHIYMRFARKYIRRASKRGHIEAIARMQELRSCVMCGAEDAPLACSLCRQARYCDSVCAVQHWCNGGGVGGGVSGGAGARHMDTCPRTRARRSHG